MKIAIIGAGLGGLSAAIRLAYKGYDVSIFEKNSQAGGKLNSIKLGQYYFDIGPSLLTMPFVIEELFSSVGEDINNYLALEPIEPICRYFYDDKTTFDTFSDIQKAEKEFTHIFPNEFSNYKNYLDYSKKIYDLTADLFLFNSLNKLKSLINKKNISTLFQINKIDSFRTVHQANSSFFKEPKLVQLFDRYATYNGSDPYKAPATLNIITHVEYGLGSFYIKGGMYNLAIALEKLCFKFGVKIQYNTTIDEIVVNKDNAKSIIANDTEYQFDKIICNTDTVETFHKLIKNYPNEQKKLSQLEPSVSGLIYLWGVKQDESKLKHHNIFFSNDYKEEFNSIFNDLTPPKDPTVYFAITSKKDDTHAPKDSMNMFTLLNMPYIKNKINWKDESKRLKDTIFTKLQKHNIDFSNSIEEERIITPEDLYDMYQSNRGSIYGISSNNKYTAFLRPKNQHHKIHNLYFCGGSSHPGGGIPLVILSGKHVADLISQ
jgi:phytoene desaturase